MSATAIPRPAWREPMLWLVIALPALSVIAGLSTLFIALRAGGADAIPFEVQRTAQIQVEDLRADRQAAQLGLHAQLSIDPLTGALTLKLSPLPPADLQLHLLLAHPGMADADQQLLLTRSGAAWYGRIGSKASPHAWNLQLRASDGRWRLRGRLPAGSDSTELSPAVLE